MTHAELVAELSGQIEAHFPECAVVIENDDGEAFELVDVAFENVNDQDQILVKIARKS